MFGFKVIIVNAYDNCGVNFIFGGCRKYDFFSATIKMLSTVSSGDEYGPGEVWAGRAKERLNVPE